MSVVPITMVKLWPQSAAFVAFQDLPSSGRGGGGEWERRIPFGFLMYLIDTTDPFPPQHA